MATLCLGIRSIVHWQEREFFWKRNHILFEQNVLILWDLYHFYCMCSVQKKPYVVGMSQSYKILENDFNYVNKGYRAYAWTFFAEFIELLFLRNVQCFLWMLYQPPNLVFAKLGGRGGILTYIAFLEKIKAFYLWSKWSSFLKTQDFPNIYAIGIQSLVCME